MLSVNHQLQLLKSESIDKSYGISVENTFTHLGSNTWEWTYLTYENGIKAYKSVILENWHKGGVTAMP